MINTARCLSVTTTSGQLLHQVQFRDIAAVDELERLRLLGPLADPAANVIATCPCGWSGWIRSTIDELGARKTAVDHCTRDATLPIFQVGAHSLIGSREVNADSYASAVSDTTGLAAFAVADGIGDRIGPATVAACAANTAVNAAISTEDGTDPAREGLIAAHNSHRLHTEDDAVMVVASCRVAEIDNHATWDIAWVGDCRAYLLEEDELTQLTIDHTHGQYLRDRGVAEKIAARHDHVVVTSVGQADLETIGTASVTSHRGRRLALISDGVGKPLPYKEIHRVLTKIKRPDRCARRLTELAVDRDRADNATAMVIDIVTTS